MPTFNITAPDGRKFRVTGENAEGALAAVQSMGGGEPAPEQPAMDFQGRFDPLGQDGARKGDRQPMAVATPPQTEFAPRPAGEQPPGMLESVVSGAADMATLGFGDEIAGGIKAAFGGDYEQTVEGIRGRQQAAQEAHPIAFGAGQVAGAIPAALVPGGAAVRATGLIGKMGAGAAVGGVQGAAYGAGSADGDTADRLKGAGSGALAGTIVGGAVPVVGQAIGKMVGVRAAIKNAPDSKALGKAAGDLYDTAEKAGVTINPQSFVSGVGQIMRDLRAAGINAKQQPKSFETFDLLRKAQAAASRGAPVGLKDIETLRQIAGNVLKDQDANERRITHVIVDGIDDFMDRLKPADVLAGDAQLAVRTLGAARDLWKRKSKSAIIEQAFERAKNAVGANYTSAGFQTALRQKFKAIADNQNAFRRFSKDEQAAILSVVRGAPIQNALRKVGKFAPTGYLTGAGSLGLAAVTNPWIAAGAAATTLTAKKASEGLAKRSANKALAIMRTGQAKPFDAAAAQSAEAGTLRALTPIAQGAVVPRLSDLGQSRPLEITVNALPRAGAGR